MLDIQYELSGDSSDISKLTISKEVIEGKVKPIRTEKEERKAL
jgi:predicted HNH restriction endonuclease